MSRMRIGFSMVMLAMFILTASLAAAQYREPPPPPPGAPYERAPNPVGYVTIKITEVGLGVGITWGEGFLRYMGRSYKFKCKGLNAVAVGVTTIRARGEVYNLRNVDDFAGNYGGVTEGAALVKGPAGLVLKNTNGVVMNLKASQTGVELKLGDQGLDVTPQWR